MGDTNSIMNNTSSMMNNANSIMNSTDSMMNNTNSDNLFTDLTNEESATVSGGHWRRCYPRIVVRRVWCCRYWC